MKVIEAWTVVLKVQQLAEVTTPEELTHLIEEALRLSAFLGCAPYGATLKQLASLMYQPESYIMGILNIFMRAGLVERVTENNKPVLYKLKLNS